MLDIKYTLTIINIIVCSNNINSGCILEYSIISLVEMCMSPVSGCQ